MFKTMFSTLKDGIQGWAATDDDVWQHVKILPKILPSGVILM